MFAVEIGISFIQGCTDVMNLHDPGLLHTSGFSTGLLMATINIQVQCPVLLWVWFTIGIGM